MSRIQARPDCLDVMLNPKRMTRSEIAGFQNDFNVNLSAGDEDDAIFDTDPDEFADLDVIDDEAFIHQFVLNDD